MKRMKSSVLLAAAAVAILGVREGAMSAAKPPRLTVPTQATPATEATKELYLRLCQACHGPDGKSPLKDLSFVDRTWKHGTKTSDMAEVISEGVPGTLMVSFRKQLTESEIRDLARYVRALDSKLPPEKQ